MISLATNEEKKAIAKARQKAVYEAWKEEKIRVQNGFGSRDWSISQQKEILENRSVKGYEGHHMKSVKEYPEFAGDPKNIQFLSEEEHFQGAHRGSYRNSTNGYYNPDTQTMHEFNGDELKEPPVNKLSNPIVQGEVNTLNTSQNNHGDKIADGGGARAPNENTRGNTDNPPKEKNPSPERGKKPPQNAPPPQTTEPTQKGHLPKEPSKIDSMGTNSAATEASKAAEEAAKKGAEQETKALSSATGMGV